MSRWLAMHPPARETKRPPAQPPPALVRAPDAADTSAAMTDRVRFAPSPTGYLHVGGARTALFNWLYARRTSGTFLLRIEDTDKQRSTDEYTQVILDGLKWLGLDWDEDLTFQGARVKRHQEVADKLLAEGKAYLEEGAIRLLVPPGEIAWDDAVHGRISFQGEDIKDFVILRSDRSPLYNFAVVVDDVDMAITHVLRGDDHISNTPKQIALYHALGAASPVFGHVPMINGPDGKKLSKRHGATAVWDYQHLGILPAAMRNFLALPVRGAPGRALCGARRESHGGHHQGRPGLRGGVAGERERAPRGGVHARGARGDAARARRAARRGGGQGVPADPHRAHGRHR